jgi:phenylalanyl-tRNA synthetase beta chain
MIKLKNPLDFNKPYLRTSILQTLIDTVKLNFSRGFFNVNLFEISQIGFNDIPESKINSTKESKWLVPNQDYYFAGICTSIPIDKCIKIINEIFNAFKVDCTMENFAVDSFHPGVCVIYKNTNNSIFGTIGQFHPQVVKNFDLLNKKTIAFEFNLSKIISEITNVTIQNTLSKWPVAKTDLAFVLNDIIPANKLVQCVKDSSNLIENITNCDIYTNESLKIQGQKSIALTVTFRSYNKTLDSAQINELRNSIINRVEQKLAGQLRDF